MHQINVSAIISTLSGEIKNRRDFDAFDDTHMEELVVYWIQYENLLKYKVGCFPYVYTIN